MIQADSKLYEQKVESYGFSAEERGVHVDFLSRILSTVGLSLLA